MNWDDLKLFLAVARKGSISGGAKQLNIQHSTVSRRMRKLEDTLGVRILERKKKGLELTEAGQKLKLSASRIECEIMAVDGALLGKDTNMVGCLKVAALNNMASTILMPIFADFNRLYPEVDLHIIVSNTDTSLSQREADVAIRLTNSPQDTLIGKQVCTVASTIYGGYDYISQIKKQNIEPRWLGVECCTFHKIWTKKYADHQGHNFYVDDTLLTLSALKENLGVSMLPCFMGDSTPELVRYCEPVPEWNLGLWLLIHPDLKRTARVLTFRDHMAESIKAQRNLFEGNIDTA